MTTTTTNPPHRIQLSRKAGWRKPLGAVTVARPTIYGNPFAANGDRALAVAWTRAYAVGANGRNLCL